MGSQATGGATLDLTDPDDRSSRSSDVVPARTRADHEARLAEARAYRLCGTPHLARELLASISREVLSELVERVQWELVLLGCDDILESANFMPVANSPADLLQAVFRHCRGGARAELDTAIDALASLVAHDEEFLWDVQRLSCALRMRSSGSVAVYDDIDAWQLGISTAAPPDLRGVFPTQPLRPGTPSAYAILRGSDEPAVRILAAGLPALEAIPVEPSCDPPGRVDAFLVQLAFAGTAGLTEEELFFKIYGLRYARARHGVGFRVLLHRARLHLGARGEIREEGRFRLHARMPLALIDPDSVRVTEDCILWCLAGSRKSARALARELSIPLRSIQLGLEFLVAGGRAKRIRRGRHYDYGTRLPETTAETGIAL